MQDLAAISARGIPRQMMGTVPVLQGVNFASNTAPSTAVYNKASTLVK